MKTKPKDTVFHGGTRRLLPGQALRLPRRGGELTVLRGRLWLTRGQDPGDHFIAAGQRVRLGDHENAVIEPAESARGVSLHWEPCRPGLAGALLARPLSGAAFLAFVAARGFAALARQAAAAARRARGDGEISGGPALFVALEGGRAREPGRRC
ncbi:Protein of unknown function (DUF2917) [Polaromonas sp. CF318]|uniref:DUF2917 domain-containing protein n=1 Tax=Polaromonas sp. CF318 TaxID=1144318 RepID=UPI0002713596|nr:DUF2917 domain-containing protein [Polaromonas sp. CF318]EJL82922.1 Protein of unknown function (DUF2917) [Polaromonas sp. CF318]